jgi:hypothetical protein
MCIIAIKKRGSKYPSLERVKTMCDNNNDGFAIVWQAGNEPVRNYRTLNKAKFLKKYKTITSEYKAKDVSLFIHARIKTHGTEKLENCHGWIDNKIGLAFAHNGILSIKNRDDMTDSETFFRDIFAPAFELGGWEAGERCVKACIGTSKFAFMDARGDIFHFGQYIQSTDDGVLYSNDSYLDFRTRFQSSYGGFGYCGGYRVGNYDKGWENERWKNDSVAVKRKEITPITELKEKTYEDFDDWNNTDEYWKNHF